MLIGFTGKRGVGKSEAATFLQELGYVRAHAFEAGKAATEAYFEHLGATADIASAMVYGGLRDLPSPLLPGNQTPRFFMEKFGKFMGTTLGPEWTLGVAIRRIQNQRAWADIVVESVVYEAELFRELKGTIVRIVRPDSTGPVGLETDLFEATIEADVTIVNDGSLDELRQKVQVLA